MTIDYVTWIEKSEAQFAATLAAFPAMRTGQVHETGQDIALMVVEMRYAKGTTDEQVIRHTVAPEMVVMTSDGRPAEFNTWHEGTSTDSVYYERWTAAGRIAHGWVDATSRRLVQAG